MADRGHTANQEDKAALEQVRDFMTRNQFSRFADWNDDRNRPVSMMGFRKVDKGDNVTEPVVTFYVPRQAGRRSVRDLTRVRWRVVCGRGLAETR